MMPVTKSPVIVCLGDSGARLAAEKESRQKMMAHIAIDPYKPPEYWRVGSPEFRICHYMVSLIDELLRSPRIETWESGRKFEREQGFFYPAEFGVACSLVSQICGGTGNPEDDLAGHKLDHLTPGGVDAEFDEKYKEAVVYVNETGVASVGSIQRKLRLGYCRAAMIVERMKKEGVLPGAELQAGKG